MLYAIGHVILNSVITVPDCIKLTMLFSFGLFGLYQQLLVNPYDMDMITLVPDKK